MEQINQLLKQQQLQNKNSGANNKQFALSSKISLSSKDFSLQNNSKVRSQEIITKELKQQINQNGEKYMQLSEEIMKNNYIDVETVKLLFTRKNTDDLSSVLLLLLNPSLVLQEDVVIQIIQFLLEQVKQKINLKVNLTQKQQEQKQIQENSEKLNNITVILKDLFASNTEQIIQFNTITFILAFLSLPVTKDRLIKYLRNNKEGFSEKLEDLLQIIYISLQITDFKEQNSFQPSILNMEVWVASLIDSFYLNFCIKDILQCLLQKIDQEFQNYQDLFEEVIDYSETLNNYLEHQKQVEQSIQDSNEGKSIYYKTISL